MSPKLIRNSKDLNSDIVYVVGGLYGNIEALDAIECRVKEDEVAAKKPLVVFNGDFNFFNNKDEEWVNVNKRGLLPIALPPLSSPLPT
jgi:hypothetical protein